MLRTLHLDTQATWRGGQSQALLLMRGLRERGHEAELMAPRGSALALRAAGAGITVHTVGAAFPRAGMAWKLRFLPAHSAGGKAFDIVHAHDSHALAAAWMAGVHCRAALITSRRVAYQLFKGKLAQARYRAARRVIAVSDFVARSMEGRGVDAARIAIVHDGVLIPPPGGVMERESARRAARARWKIGEEELAAGCASQLSPEKGQEILLRALALLSRGEADGKRLRLILAGAGRDRGRLELLARELGVAERVTFTGFVEDMDSVFAALDIFLFPSLAEPLGSSLLDAMAHGLPCIAVNSGGVPEVIEAGVNGVLASPEPGAFAAAISRLANDRQERARLGAAARETIAARFSAARMIDATLEIYEKSALPRSA